MTRALFVFVLTLVILMVLPGHGVSAHAELIAAEPAPGAQLAESPAELRLTFNESLEPDSTFVLFGDDFFTVPGISPVIDIQSPEQLFSDIPSLSPGIYTVQWTAATIDGHESTGSYSFGVNSTDSPAPVQSTFPSLGWLLVVLPVALAILIFLVRRRGR